MPCCGVRLCPSHTFVLLITDLRRELSNHHGARSKLFFASSNVLAEPRELSWRDREDFYDPLWLIPRVLTKLNSVWVRAFYPFASCGHHVSLHYTCDLHHTELMHLGNFITIHKDVWLHAHPARGERIGPALIIEDKCFIGRRSHLSAKNRICIGRGVMLSASVLIEDHHHAYTDVSMPICEQEPTEGGRIRIGEGSWIGQNAVIFCEKGELTLGRNCVVAANAVVTRSAPAYSVLSGNPARIVKQYDTAKGVWVLGSAFGIESEGRESAREGRTTIAGA